MTIEPRAQSLEPQTLSPRAGVPATALEPGLTTRGHHNEKAHTVRLGDQHPHQFLCPQTLPRSTTTRQCPRHTLPVQGHPLQRPSLVPRALCCCSALLNHVHSLHPWTVQHTRLPWPSTAPLRVCSTLSIRVRMLPNQLTISFQPAISQLLSLLQPAALLACVRDASSSMP